MNLRGLSTKDRAQLRRAGVSDAEIEARSTALVAGLTAAAKVAKPAEPDDDDDDRDPDDDDPDDDEDEDDGTEAMIRSSCAVVPAHRRTEHEVRLRARLAALPKSAPKAAAPRTRHYETAPPEGVSYGTPMGGTSPATERAALIASAPKAFRATLQTMPTSMLAKTIEGLKKRSA